MFSKKQINEYLAEKVSASHLASAHSSGGGVKKNLVSPCELHVSSTCCQVSTHSRPPHAHLTTRSRTRTPR